MIFVVKDDAVRVGHVRIFVVTLDLFVVLEAKEILQLGEVLLMSRHEIIHIVDSVRWNIRSLGKQPLVGLLALRITRQQENLVDSCESLEVALVPYERFEHLVSQFGVQA